jgi:putative phosphoesterase
LPGCVYTVGLVSDTHVPTRAHHLPRALLSALSGAERILHAGDLVTSAVITELSAIAPVTAVAGNMDGSIPPGALPFVTTVEFGGVRVGLTHGHLGRGRDVAARSLSAFEDLEVDVVVFGHTHVPLCEWREGVLLANPGSPTDPRREPRGSFGLLRIDLRAPAGERVSCRIHFL